MGDRVLDIQQLKKIFSGMVSVLVTVIPLLLSVQQQAPAGTDACSLNAADVAVIKGLLGGRNGSCIWNQTFSEILV